MNGLNPSNAPWSNTSGVTAITNATAAVIVAAVTNKKHYLTDLHIVNTHASVSTLVSILDGTTVIWTGYVPAITAALQVAPLIVQFSTPLSNTVGASISIKANTTGANIYWSATGFDA